MHAYLIISLDSNLARDYATKLSLKLKSIFYEFPFEKIEDARELTKFTKLSLSKKTAIFLNRVDQATVEASNAFLKNLEEAPKNLIYILSAASEFKVLPTIISRCQVIRLKSENKNKLLDFTRKFIESDKLQKFKMLEDIQKRDEAINFCIEFEKALQNLLIRHKYDAIFLADAIDVCENTYLALSKNANVGLQMTKLIVNFPDLNSFS